MFAKIENWLTLGGQYTAAAAIYFGLALILGGSTFLDSWQALAQETEEPSCSYTVDAYQEGVWVPVTYDGCPDGQQCCGGDCISEDDLCCDDGTHGDPDSCICCSACNEDSCEGTTISCNE